MAALLSFPLNVLSLQRFPVLLSLTALSHIQYYFADLKKNSRYWLVISGYIYFWLEFVAPWFVCFRSVCFQNTPCEYEQNLWPVEGWGGDFFILESAFVQLRSTSLTRLNSRASFSTSGKGKVGIALCDYSRSSNLDSALGEKISSRMKGWPWYHPRSLIHQVCPPKFCSPQS